MHIAACTSFEIDISVEPHTSECLKNHPKPDSDLDDPELKLSQWAETNPDGMSFRLNPKGYR